MAKCDCGREMSGKGTGCKLTEFLHEGKWNKRIPWDEDRHCGDCNCPPNKYHHIGCDMERCPFCGGQFAFCDCYGDSLELR